MKKSSIGRLQEILNQVDDEQIREIIRGVFKIEISYRSTERTNFPRKRILDTVDGVARTIENNTKQLSIDEVPKN